MWMWLLPRIRRGNRALVLQSSVRTEGNEDILDARMMKLGTKVLVAPYVTVAVQTQQTNHERDVLGANGGPYMIPPMIVPSVESMPRIVVDKDI